MRILIGCASQTAFVPFKKNWKKAYKQDKMCNRIHYTMNATIFQFNQVISSSKLKFVDKYAV